MTELVCAICKKVFEDPDGLEAAQKEAGELWTGEMGDVLVVCDTCWEQFIKWMKDRVGPPPWPADPTPEELEKWKAR